jgi:hypothetical protein
MIRGEYVLPQGSADKIMAPVVPGKPARGHGMFPSHPVELTQQHLKQERKPDVVQQSRIEGRIMSELILQHYTLRLATASGQVELSFPGSAT